MSRFRPVLLLACVVALPLGLGGCAGVLVVGGLGAAAGGGDAVAQERGVNGSIDDFTVKNEIARNREEMSAAARSDRKEISASIISGSDSNARRIVEIGEAQKHQLDSFAKQIAGLTDRTEQRLEAMRTTVEAKL